LIQTQQFYNQKHCYEFVKLFSLGFIVALLSSCGTLPERVESDDIPSWCQEEEEYVSLIPYLILGISTIVQISDALADESFYACGIATGSEVGATRTSSSQHWQCLLTHPCRSPKCMGCLRF
jgi:hypothetical protein